MLKPREPRPVHTTSLAIVRDLLELACSAARMVEAGEFVAVIAASEAAAALGSLARGAQCAPEARSPDLGRGLARHLGQLCVTVWVVEYDGLGPVHRVGAWRVGGAGSAGDIMCF